MQTLSLLSALAMWACHFDHWATAAAGNGSLAHQSVVLQHFADGMGACSGALGGTAEARLEQGADSEEPRSPRDLPCPILNHFALHLLFASAHRV